MDVMLESSTSPTTSKHRVLTVDADQVWRALVSMGRPLWRSRQRGGNLADRQRAMNLFAASMLLRGRKARLPESYSDSTLNGVASLFCRVGLHLRSCDPLTTRLVTDFMSVLHYEMYKNNFPISSYASNPVLAFGASRVWYQLEPPAIETRILPQRLTMLANGVVDACNICHIVARISSTSYGHSDDGRSSEDEPMDQKRVRLCGTISRCTKFCDHANG
ncbi:hypothetical protein GN244_ATG18509 [Phytophthora infestans]|uniref:Uncharacterized protein n=1 Tax=Phytophthora infestans TaxID=4787 RepID=A0A833SHQ1_PHYIN|nr:hypothetical protein GN244_ATG18509 [Phytophthora infestans]